MGLLVRTRRAIRILSALALLSVVAFEAWAWMVASPESTRPLPPNVGNFARVRERLWSEPASGDFSFAVVGDTKGVGTFERIAERLRDEPLAFVALLGDFVFDATEPDHALFRAEAPEYGFRVPVLLVAGNHDVEVRGRPGRLTVGDFEARYGPTNFHFSYGDCLFLVLRTLTPPGSNRDTLRFAEETLAAERGRHRWTFVLMHIPPPVSDDFSARAFEGSRELMALFERHGVDYVFAGDHHGYARVQRGGVRYLVSGGGGGRLSDGKYGRFHHALVVEVGRDAISERILETDHDWDVGDVAERVAITRLLPWSHRNPGLLLAAHAAVVALWIPWIRRERVASGARRGGGGR